MILQYIGYTLTGFAVFISILSVCGLIGLGFEWVNSKLFEMKLTHRVDWIMTHVILPILGIMLLGLMLAYFYKLGEDILT